jgi:large subunit ribosomal protein L1
MQAIRAKVEAHRAYALQDALQLVRETATARFPESVDVAVKLGVDPRKSDQMVRGSVVLPHGRGRTVRVAAFAQGQAAEDALAAGADVVGMDDLAQRMKDGELDFDVVIAAVDAMRVVAPLGRLLGPRGLMPNPKVGTVTQDVAGAVRQAKAGQVRFRVDKGGVVHCPIGRATFSSEQLQENLQALLADLQRLKPSAAKGAYFRSIAVSSTMGPGIYLDRQSLGL